MPRPLQILGSGGFLLLVATLPWQEILPGVGVFIAGIAYRGPRARRAGG